MSRLGIGTILRDFKDHKMELAYGFDIRYYARIMTLNEKLNQYELKEFISANTFEHLNTKIHMWYKKNILKVDTKISRKKLYGLPKAKSTQDTGR